MVGDGSGTDTGHLHRGSRLRTTPAGVARRISRDTDSRSQRQHSVLTASRAVFGPPPFFSGPRTRPRRPHRSDVRAARARAPADQLRSSHPSSDVRHKGASVTSTTSTPGHTPSGSPRPVAEPRVPENESEALASVESAEPVGVPSPRGMARAVLSTLAQPGPLAREAGRLGWNTVRILRGTKEIAPSPRDKRFADPAWSANPAYRRLAQSYLAVTGSLNSLVEAYEARGADWREVEQARFVLTAFPSALAPTNTLLGNPAAVKRAFDTGGRSVLRGLGHMVSDLRHNGGLPPQTDRSAFTVGEDLGISPGAVVHRDEVIELIQYTPTTAQVRQRPLVIVPPPIGRFYFLDLRPGRSLVEYAVSRGLQVFMI